MRLKPLMKAEVSLQQHKVIISGGGTGGHIFPAIAIANALKEIEPGVEILFVGAVGRMEMEKVPAAGYKIEGLHISGLQRSLSLKNLMFPFKVIKSVLRSRAIIKSFKPDVVVGVGGYASGPLLYAASSMHIPCLIQEQNSFPGITNKILSKRVQKICVAYENMEKFFPKDKLKLTGNPVRKDIVSAEGKKQEAIRHFGLDPSKATVLVIGGSLGARTINLSVAAMLKDIETSGLQMIWQTGKGFFKEAGQLTSSIKDVHAFEFIGKMDLAYAAADVVISRAGAISVSELQVSADRKSVV